MESTLKEQTYIFRRLQYLTADRLDPMWCHNFSYLYPTKNPVIWRRVFFSCITLLRNLFVSEGRRVRARETCLRSLLHHFPCRVFCCSDLKYNACSLQWTLKCHGGVGGGRDCSRDCSRDCRRMISFYCYFKQVCPCDPEDTEEDAKPGRTACLQILLHSTYQCSGAWTTNTKPIEFLKYTCHPPLLPHSAVTDVLYSGWLSEHHSLGVMPVLTRYRGMNDGFNLVSLREDLHFIYFVLVGSKQRIEER